LNNDRVTLQALAQPLQEAGRAQLDADPASVGLLIHDWSKLRLNNDDAAALTHDQDVGYELMTALLASADDGRPLAPMRMDLKTGEAVHSTAGGTGGEAVADLPHVDQVLQTMRAARGWGLSKPLVHVVDREADSIGHYRQWDEAGALFLVRGDDRRVNWEGASVRLKEVCAALSDQGGFTPAGSVDYRGKPREHHVAQTRVTLDRPARRHEGGRQVQISGRAIELRLVVSEVRGDGGRVLARWMLLTNVDESAADAATVARWYAWRWKIESYFKLLKSHGHEVDYWQQESGLAVARRLLVCAMACVTVWDLQRQQTREADELRQLLVRLSGRQMKHGVTCTAPALLAGLSILMPMLVLVDEDVGALLRLKHLAKKVLPMGMRDV
jgi:hypothetical protein